MPDGAIDPDRPSPPLRLKRRADFLRASGAAKVHGRSFTLQVVRRLDGSDEPWRVGLTVTRKVGNAVERNRIKRRLREVLRVPGLAAQASHDYVIVARREALRTRFVGLVSELKRSLDDAKSGRVRKGGGSRSKPVGSPIAAKPKVKCAQVRGGAAREPRPDPGSSVISHEG